MVLQDSLVLRTNNAFLKKTVFSKISFCFICMGVLPGCIFVYLVGISYSWGPEKDVRLPGT